MVPFTIIRIKTVVRNCVVSGKGKDLTLCQGGN